ncbi:MAG TPA: OmpA family protein [Bacteroidia bacterium]|jgi:outer membrane protein OmpA-like peptidoglycan-associated protein|nr:OmpA family protein [Bacteroidia bacterium]
MKKQFLYYLMFVFSFSLAAQNLVLNGDFESKDSVSKPRAEDIFSANHILGFYNPTYGTPDLYLIRNGIYNWKPDCNISPHSGNTFAGFLFCSTPGTGDYYEYIGAELTTPLVKGGKYLLTFYLAADEYNTCLTDEIGVHFSGQKLMVASGDMLNPSFENASANISNYFKEKEKWWEVYVLYTATGGEKYLTLGCFEKLKQSSLVAGNTNDSISPVKNKTSSQKGLSCYFYLDDLSLVEYGNPVVAGKKIIADDIHFTSGDSTIDGDSYWKLDLIASELSQNLKIKAEIDGHTDSTGTTDANQKLSEARARAVKRYFISKGIAANRITTKGYGSSKPLGKDPVKNRRVEFIFSE